MPNCYSWQSDQWSEVLEEDEYDIGNLSIDTAGDSVEDVPPSYISQENTAVIAF